MKISILLKTIAVFSQHHLGNSVKVHLNLNKAATNNLLDPPQRLVQSDSAETSLLHDVDVAPIENRRSSVFHGHFDADAHQEIFNDQAVNRPTAHTGHEQLPEAYDNVDSPVPSTPLPPNDSDLPIVDLLNLPRFQLDFSLTHSDGLREEQVQYYDGEADPEADYDVETDDEELEQYKL